MYHTLKALKKKYGHMKITQNYIVPNNESDVPLLARGMDIGRKLYLIKYRGLFPSSKYKFEALGKYACVVLRCWLKKTRRAHYFVFHFTYVVVSVRVVVDLRLISVRVV